MALDYPADFQDVPFNFLGLPEPENGIAGARVCILPIPYESTTSYRAGTRCGPAAVIDASRYVETYDEELNRDLADLPILTLPAVAPLLGSAEAMMERIREIAGRAVSRDRLMVALGGEHSITPPLVEAHLRTHGDLTVVHLDAHADLRDSYEGSRMSHASAIRRVSELARVLSVGVRSISGEESAWLKRQDRVDVVFAHEMRRHAGLIDEKLGAVRGNVYLTVDVDVFDPSVVPGVGTPEPAGLSWVQVYGVVERLARQCSIVGADVVELSPVPGSVVSEFAVARFVAKMIACIEKPF